MLETPPKAKKIEKTLEIHGDKRLDHYFWMNDIKNQDVMTYLKDENAYLERTFSPNSKLQSDLFEEIKGRIKEADSSAPMKEGDYWYYYRYEKGKQYPIFCRSHGGPDEVEEITLDQNELAEGKSFLDIGFVRNSPDHRYLAYGVDEDGDEAYQVFIKNLETGEIFDLGVSKAASSFVWLSDSQSFLFTMLDDNFRPSSTYRGKLGADLKNVTKVFEEEDPGFFMSLDMSEDREYVFICLHGNNSSEYRYSKNDANNIKFKIFEKRRPDHEYELSHLRGKFLVLSNWNAENFALYEAETTNPNIDQWKFWRAYEENVLTESFTILRDYLLIEEKEKALPRIRMIHLETGDESFVDYGDEACSLEVIAPREYDTNTFRFEYSSMSSPSIVYDYDLTEQTKHLVKVQEIPDKTFKSSNYVSKRIYIDSKDGVSIPVSLLYRKDLDLDHPHKLYLYAYGSYGSSMDASFSSSRISYVDRGMIYAIAHVRGGMELGRKWYLDGKLKKKQNTFDDFIAVAEGLINLGYTSKGRIVASGGSAGGLLIGAVSNQRPDLFGAMIANVPFVDVLTTMLDSSLPLTTIEYNEWGNPEIPEFYSVIKSYSPYDNVTSQDYPSMLVICGLNDMRVTYWEPAKWVAKLREFNTSDRSIYFKTHMDAGHGGSSGRYDYLKDIALEIAFVLKELPE